MADLLIVDDDRDIAEAAAESLACEGHTIRIARDGVEGLELLRERRPDVVLLDVEMPRLTGPEMAYQAFLTDAGLEQVPVVLLSGAVDLLRMAARVGTPYFLAKPYKLETLLALLARVLVEREPPRPAEQAPAQRSP
jgi:DNA-binding NtrC family response regulator